jgi:hypothetical protein
MIASSSWVQALGRMRETELESALNRRRRDGSLTAEDEAPVRRCLERLEESWLEVQPTVTVRDRALRLLRVHPLRSADAFQLGAALVACAEQTRGKKHLLAPLIIEDLVAIRGFRMSFQNGTASTAFTGRLTI